MVNQTMPKQAMVNLKTKRGGRMGFPAHRPTMILLAFVIVAFGFGPFLQETARAQSSTLYYFTVKKGQLDPSNSGDTYLKELETTHGDPNDDRVVQPLSFELDIYGITSGSFGLGVGLEALGYTKTYFFPDGEVVHMGVKGMHFTLKTFLRYGAFLPFLGLGIGNYYVNLSQSSGLSIRESPEEVYNARVGFRYQPNRWGILLEYGVTHAELEVPGQQNKSTLELGGQYTNLGISWIF